MNHELIISLKQGEITALREIYHVFFNRVFHFACKLTLNDQDAEEVTQDVFVRLWEKRESIDCEKSIAGFLFTVAKNLVIDKMRKHAATEARLIAIYKSQHTAMPIRNQTEELVNYFELSEIISKLVNDLPDGRRTIFKLSREKGFKNSEIAEFLNISVGTVEKQMSKAIQTLSRELKDKYGIMVDLIAVLGFFLFSL